MSWLGLGSSVLVEHQRPGCDVSGTVVKVKSLLKESLSLKETPKEDCLKSISSFHQSKAAAINIMLATS